MLTVQAISPTDNWYADCTAQKRWTKETQAESKIIAEKTNNSEGADVTLAVRKRKENCKASDKGR